MDHAVFPFFRTAATICAASDAGTRGSFAPCTTKSAERIFSALLTGAVFVMGLSMLGSVVPTPGGATGPFHTATTASLTFLGIDHTKAASVAIILHLVIFTPETFFGMYYLVKEGLSLENLKSIGEKQADDVEQQSKDAPIEEEPHAEKEKVAALPG